MRSKLTNVQKILKALQSGPKTQADLVRETKVKNVYQIISDLKKKKLVFMDTGKCVNLMKVPVAVDETDKVSAKEVSNVVGRSNPQWPWPSNRVIQMLETEIKNIDDGIRSLEITKSYLQRRIEEEKRDA
jgi:hypothetical protein